MLKTILLFASCVIINIQTIAQDELLRQQFKYGVMSKDNVEIPFRLFTPENKLADQRYPLILALHGAGESGTNNESQLYRYFALGWSRPEVQNKYSCYVLAPQVFNFTWNYPATIQIIDLLIDSLISAEPIDVNRIYLTGYSMGGWAAWYYPYRFPKRFAATVPMSSFWDTTSVLNSPNLIHLIRNYPGIPIWNFHHRKDKDQEIGKSREIIKAFKSNESNVLETNPYDGENIALTDAQLDALIEKGAKFIYTEYDYPCKSGIMDCHWIGDIAVKDTLLHRWLFGQRLNAVSNGVVPIIAQNNPFTVYPNPVNEVLHLNKLPHNATIGIFTIDGCMVKQLNISGNTNDIDVSYLQRGIYILRVKSKGGVFGLTFIKQ